MKTVFITGATSGIGKACAEKFAKNGFKLILLARREERLIAIANELNKKYKTPVTTITADVRDYALLKNKIEALSVEDQKIDILVNNAGLALGLSPIFDGDITQWDTMIDTNIKGLLYITRIVAPLMIKQHAGHIFNIGSIAGKETYANGNVYCATKHAVDSLSKAMRIDLLPYGIKVTNIAPGMVDTEFSLVRFDGDENRAKTVYKGMQPLLPEDIAEAIYFAAQQPDHVNFNDMLIMPKVQANSTTTLRKE